MCGRRPPALRMRIPLKRRRLGRSNRQPQPGPRQPVQQAASALAAAAHAYQSTPVSAASWCMRPWGPGSGVGEGILSRRWREGRTEGGGPHVRAMLDIQVAHEVLHVGGPGVHAAPRQPVLQLLRLPQWTEPLVSCGAEGGAVTGAQPLPSTRRRPFEAPEAQRAGGRSSTAHGSHHRTAHSNWASANGWVR